MRNLLIVFFYFYFYIKGISELFIFVIKYYNRSINKFNKNHKIYKNN